MKKVLFSAMIAAVIAFTGCTKSNDTPAETQGSNQYVPRGDNFEESEESEETIDTSQHTAATQEELVYGLLQAFVSKDKDEFNRYPSDGNAYQMSPYDRFYNAWCRYLQKNDVDYNCEYTLDDYAAYISPIHLEDHIPTVNVVFPASEPVFSFYISFYYDYTTEEYKVWKVSYNENQTQERVLKSFEQDKEKGAELIDFSQFAGGADRGE